MSAIYYRRIRLHHGALLDMLVESSRTMLVLIYFMAALLTAMIETTFFWCCKYRSKAFLTYVFAVNILTNVLINQVLRIAYPFFSSCIYYLIFLLELGVFISEFILLSAYLRKDYARIFILVFLANLITWSLGEVLF